MNLDEDSDINIWKNDTWLDVARDGLKKWLLFYILSFVWFDSPSNITIAFNLLNLLQL